MWDQRYSSDLFVYGTEPNEFLRGVADQIDKGRILCLGEGEGRNAVYLAQLGHQVVAVDSSAVGLSKAARLAKERCVEIETVHADLAHYDIQARHWDAIVSIFCHLPGALRRRLHRNVVQGLRSGGLFVLEAYTPAQLAFASGGPPNEALMMSLAELRYELQGLTFLQGRETEREVVEGHMHTGRGAVVQVVARKD